MKLCCHSKALASSSCFLHVVNENLSHPSDSRVFLFVHSFLHICTFEDLLSMTFITCFSTAFQNHVFHFSISGTSPSVPKSDCLQNPFSNCLYLVLFFSNAGKPMFTKRIVPMEINVGNAVKFNCEIQEAPDVSFDWFKDGHQVKEGDRYRIISHSGTSCLEILHPIKEDHGLYTCKVSNQHGSDECTASLTVTGRNAARSRTQTLTRTRTQTLTRTLTIPLFWLSWQLLLWLLMLGITKGFFYLQGEFFSLSLNGFGGLGLVTEQARVIISN